jgi:hypothetical protein
MGLKVHDLSDEPHGETSEGGMSWAPAGPVDPSWA